MRPRRRMVLGTVLLAIGAGCGAPTPAPAVGDVAEACAETSFCLGMPDGWVVVDRGPRHATIEHPDGADATIGVVEMDRVAAATGAAWPRSPEQVVRALWALFDGGDAVLGEVVTLSDGSVRSTGTVSTGVQWHLLVPLEGPTAMGVVVRAPSSSWEAHVDAIFGGARLR